MGLTSNQKKPPIPATKKLLLRTLSGVFLWTFQRSARRQGGALDNAARLNCFDRWPLWAEFFDRTFPFAANREIKCFRLQAFVFFAFDRTSNVFICHVSQSQFDKILVRSAPGIADCRSLAITARKGWIFRRKSPIFGNAPTLRKTQPAKKNSLVFGATLRMRETLSK